MVFENLVDFEHGGLSTECLNIVHHAGRPFGSAIQPPVNNESS